VQCESSPGHSQGGVPTVAQSAAAQRSSDGAITGEQKMESDDEESSGEVGSMTTIQRRAGLQCGGSADDGVCSSKKQSSSWSPTAWIWRLSSAAMVVFFATAAYVQVRTAQRVALLRQQVATVLHIT